jgi:type IV secretion system protein VirB5
MRKILTWFAFCFLFSSAAMAQIPVTDVGSITQQTLAQVETMLKWKTQYDQMVSQIKQQKDQYNSLTGSRNLGAIMNDPAMRNYLPSNWQGVYDSVRTGGYSGLSGRSQTVYNENKVFDSCSHITVPDQRTACEARAVKASQDKALALDAYDAAMKRLNQIDQLMHKINDTQDPKAIGELQGRIAIEQANIQNEQIKLQLYSMVAAADEKVQAQRQREMQARTWSATKGIDAQPLTFK